MANTKTRTPRIAITPSAALRALLEELAEVSGQSLSFVASDMLEDVVPVMRQQLDAFKLINGKPELARKHLQALADSSHGQIDQAVMEFEKTDGRTMEGKKKRRVAGAKPNP